jgi:hypothetical protein
MGSLLWISQGGSLAMLANEGVVPEQKEPQLHYVYTLSEPDGSIFYMGKGCTKELGSHFFDRIEIMSEMPSVLYRK